MSVEEKNKALIRRFFKALDEGNLDAIEEMLAPDFVDHSSLPDQEPGREGYKRLLAEDRAALSDVRTTIEYQATEGDDMIISRVIMRSIHDRGELMGIAPTGQERVSTGILIHRIVEGQIAEEWSESSGRASLMEKRLEEEARERERVEQELRVARRIQQASLPKSVPELEGWQIAPYYRPAREVGGDFYDFHLLSEGRLGLVVGDATGKGVPAALVMSTTCGMLRLAAQSPPRPARCSNESTKRSFPTSHPTCSLPASMASSTQKAAPSPTPAPATTCPTCAVVVAMQRN